MNKHPTYQVHHGQTWFDISLKLYGTPLYAFDLALLNDSNIVDTILAGTFIDFDPNLKSNSNVLTIYSNNKTNPATGFTQSDLQVIERLQGISLWAIDLDFKILP